LSHENFTLPDRRRCRATCHGISRKDRERYLGSASPRLADYGVASGIFNVALDQERVAWEHYVIDTLDAMHAATKLGFAFNCLTSYSDAEYRRPHLYYGDPRFFFDHCKRRYSRQVALLHDYGLYEFTIIVRKIT
jgi:hypothetical protein